MGKQNPKSTFKPTPVGSGFQHRIVGYVVINHDESRLPKFGGTFLGVPRIRIIVYWGLYWVPFLWETTKSGSQ